MVRFTSYRSSLVRISAALLVAVMGAGCSSSDDDDGNDDNMDPPMEVDPSVGLQAIFASRDSGYTAGLVERISVSAGDVYQTKIENGAFSDISIATDGQYIYQLGKSSADSVTKYDPIDTSAPVFQYSVTGEEDTANPYDMIFVSDTKAYLLRYDSPLIWIVNPSATSEEMFKTGEIDLSAYDDLDGIPEINGGVLVGNKLFVLMERLERPSYTIAREGYLAVIDTETDAEIDTNEQASDDLPGIPLGVQNPSSISHGDDGFIYLVGRGNYFGMEGASDNRFTGGLVSVNPDNYAADMLIDDGDEDTNAGQGFFLDYVPVSGTKGYLQTYNAWQNTSVFSVDPMTRSISADAVAGMEAMDISAMAIDPNDRLWLGVATLESASFVIIDSTTDERTTEVPTEFVPIKVVFVDVAE